MEEDYIKLTKELKTSEMEKGDLFYGYKGRWVEIIGHRKKEKLVGYLDSKGRKQWVSYNMNKFKVKRKIKEPMLNLELTIEEMIPGDLFFSFSKRWLKVIKVYKKEEHIKWKDIKTEEERITSYNSKSPAKFKVKRKAMSPKELELYKIKQMLKKIDKLLKE